MKLLGLSAYYHDAAAALIEADDTGIKILAACQEERFSRKKFDESFPQQSIHHCLQMSSNSLKDIDAIVYYEKPWLTFERLLETYLAYAPKGFQSYLTAMPRWLNQKLNMKSTLRNELSELSGLKKSQLPPLLFSSHHLSHAASAFFASPFEDAAVLCLDGVGEWSTTSTWLGKKNQLHPLWEIHFPHSLGLLYSAFTGFCGFKVNSGEYKLMGLAPFGQPRFEKMIRENLIDIKDDGTFRLNLRYFDYMVGFQMTSSKFSKLFGCPPRSPEDPIRDIDLDLAASIQKVTDDIMLRLARTLRKDTGMKNLCLSGGVALNCVANGKIAAEGIFEEIWIQPAAGDSGSALGAALAAAHLHYKKPRSPKDLMSGAALGNQYSNEEIHKQLIKAGARIHHLSPDQVTDTTAQLLAEQKVVGWYQGRMEFGPRALGHRSILADARNPEMQKIVNLKVKFREGFRPFAPIVLEEKYRHYFELTQKSPYMLLVAPITEELRKTPPETRGLQKVKEAWSLLPAVTHVDYSARIQTVGHEDHPQLHELLKAFEEKTKCPVLLNTSFNVRGEPIVESPSDAFSCFMNTNIDALVIGNFLLLKEEQDLSSRDSDWRNRFELD